MKQRVSLRSISRWAWAALALAVIWLLLQMLVAPDFSLSTIYVAFLGTTPALFAAALMWRAPTERLVRISAVAFGLPVLIQALIGGSVLFIANVLSSDYAYLGPRFAGMASAFSYVAWIFPIVAVSALALYLGLIRTRLGWLAIAWGAVLALGQIASSLVGTPLDQVPLGNLLVGILGQLVWVAWAVLLAVSLGRRLTLFTLASTSYLVAGVLSLFGLTPFNDSLTANSGNLTTQVVLAILWIFTFVPWSALLAAIVRELPRTRLEDEPLPPVRAGKRSLSAGR